MTILFVLNVCTFVMTIMQIESPYDNGLPSNFPEKNQEPFCYLWPRSQAGEKKYKLPSLDSPAWIAVAKFLLSEREAKKRSSAKAFASYFGMKDVGSMVRHELYQAVHLQVIPGCHLVITCRPDLPPSSRPGASRDPVKGCG